MTELPHGWGSEPLSALADRGGLFRDGDWVETKDQDPSGSTRLTQLADIGTGSFRDRSDRWMRPDQVARLNCTLLEPDDVLIARMPDPIGRACVVPLHLGAAVTAVDVSILRIRRPDVHPPYVMWALNSPSRNDAMAVLQSGTTRKRISRKNLGTIRVPMPPLDEQRRIVEILEDHLSRLDAADAYLEAVAVRSTALRWRRVHQLLSEAGGTELSLGALAKSIKNGIFVSRPGQTAVGVPILRIGALRQLDLDVTDLRYTGLTQEDVAGRGALLRADDLLFTRYNGNPKYVGACAVVPPGLGPITYPDKLIRVIVDLGIALPGFVALACSVGAARRQIQAAVKTTSGQAGVSGADLRKVLISVPSIATQQVIIQAASETSEAGKRMGEAAEAGTRRSAALRRALVHAAFTGRLTGRA